MVLDAPSKMQDILSELTEAAADPNEDVRLIALEAFASLASVASSVAETILPILTQAAQDEDYDTRLVALEALAKMAIAAPREASGIMPILEAAAKDQDENIREIALEALARVPRAASSEATDTTTVPEGIVDKQALYMENLLQLRAAHKPSLPLPESEVPMALQRALEARYESEMQAEKARHTQELTQLAEKKSAAESANAQLSGELKLKEEESSKLQRKLAECQSQLETQEARHAQELVRLAKEKSEEERQDKIQAQDPLRLAEEEPATVADDFLKHDLMLPTALGMPTSEVLSSMAPSSTLSSLRLSASAMPRGVASPVIDALVWQRYFGYIGATPPISMVYTSGWA